LISNRDEVHSTAANDPTPESDKRIQPIFKKAIGKNRSQRCLIDSTKSDVSKSPQKTALPKDKKPKNLENLDRKTWGRFPELHLECTPKLRQR